MADDTSGASLYLPNKFAHHYVNAITEIMGVNGRNGLLNLAGLPQYIAAPPPDNDLSEFDLTHFSALQVGYLQIFGRLGGMGLAKRAGRSSFWHIYRHTSLLELDKSSILALPPQEQMPTLVTQLCRPWMSFSAEEVVEISTDEQFCTCIFKVCPACYGQTAATIPPRMGKPSPLPICNGIVGWLWEGIRCVLGKEYPVEEVACHPVQAEKHCVFRVTLDPVTVS